MDYKKAIEDIADYFRSGYEREKQRFFNESTESLESQLLRDYFSNEDNKESKKVINHLIGAVISEIFGELETTGRYNFLIDDNALDQMRRRGYDVRV